MIDTFKVLPHTAPSLEVDDNGSCQEASRVAAQGDAAMERLEALQSSTEVLMQATKFRGGQSKCISLAFKRV